MKKKPYVKSMSNITTKKNPDSFAADARSRLTPKASEDIININRVVLL